MTLNGDFKNVTGLRAGANSEVVLAAYFMRDESGTNYALNALPYLLGVQGALNSTVCPG